MTLVKKIKSAELVTGIYRFFKSLLWHLTFKLIDALMYFPLFQKVNVSLFFQSNESFIMNKLNYRKITLSMKYTLWSGFEKIILHKDNYLVFIFLDRECGLKSRKRYAL